MNIEMRIILSVLLLCAIGCDSGKVAELEKQNAELKAEVDKRQKTDNFELQGRCAKDARDWFNGNYIATSREKDTQFLDFTDHYNAKLNKCLIVVEYHYNSHLVGARGESWTNDMTLFDVYENYKAATFSENHYIYWKPTPSTNQEVTTCEVEGTNCKTLDEFDNLLRRYMTD